MANGIDAAMAMLRRMRKDAHENAGVTSGYLADDGQARATAGDKQGPWGKLPPFPTAVEELFNKPSVAVGGFDNTEEFDVEFKRVLTLYLAYESIEPNSQLIYAPFYFNEKRGAFYPAAVVNCEIDSTKLPPAGVRTVPFSLLQTPVLAEPQVFIVNLQFEVSPFKKMIFAAGEFGEGVQNGGNIVMDISYNE